MSVYEPDHRFQDQWLDVEKCYLIFCIPVVGVSRLVWWFKYGNWCGLNMEITVSESVINKIKNSLELFC